MNKLNLFSLLFIITVNLNAQTAIHFLDSEHNISLRGLSVVNDDILWASGSNGTVVRSLDGGKNFQWITVKGYEQKDFRDIEAFDANTAIIMAVAEPAIILKTKNGGRTWKKVFSNTTKEMFLDAMDFDEDGNGIVVGDPINQKIFAATSDDFGDNWRILKDKHNNYSVTNGEAMFAASGTNVKITGMANWNILFVTGGAKSKLFLQGLPVDLLLKQGKDSQGANSVAVNIFTGKIIIVGGDFNNINSSTKNCQILTYKNGQILSTFPQTQPKGYKSCVAFISNDNLICCGLSGIDISKNGGMNWQQISAESFHVCQRAKKGSAVFLAGTNGRIAKLQL